MVASIRREGMAMELRCGELEERYRTRLLYAVGGWLGLWVYVSYARVNLCSSGCACVVGRQEMPRWEIETPASHAPQIGDAAAAQCRAELADAAAIATEWVALSKAAEARDCALEAVKARFGDDTRRQVRGGKGVIPETHHVNMFWPCVCIPLLAGRRLLASGASADESGTACCIPTAGCRLCRRDGRAG